jgi:TIGR03009 family protein
MLSRSVAWGMVPVLAVFLAPLCLAQDAPPTKPVAPPRTQTPTRAPGTAVKSPGAAAPATKAPGAPRPPASTAQAPAPAARQGKTAPGPIKQVQHQEQAIPALSPQEQAELDQVLQGWERESDKVKTLTADFTMWEYDAVFGVPAAPGQPPKPKRSCEGQIRFAAPDKGSYEVTKGDQERWMCDGKAICEFDYKQKKLKEYRLPKELQGKSITNGPLPFVFGAKADSMRQRYLMRIFTPPEEKNQIWIEAWPRWQQDAANFHHVHVILDQKVMLPQAIRVYSPNPQNYKVYGFARTNVNGTWDQIKDFFDRPRAPLTWQHVVEEPPAQALPIDRPQEAPTADSRNKATPPRPPAVKK